MSEFGVSCRWASYIEALLHAEGSQSTTLRGCPRVKPRLVGLPTFPPLFRYRGDDISSATERRRRHLKAATFYRIAAVLIGLFALGHTVGFLQHDPSWGVDALLASMKSTHFNIQGFSRSYWDFFVGFGLFVTVFLLFAAVLAWELGGLASEILARLRIITWAFALCFAVFIVLSWRFFFAIPLIFSVLITVCLSFAAARSSKPVRD